MSYLQRANLSLQDSSSYPPILKLWTRDKIRFGKKTWGQQDPDVQNHEDSLFDPWCSRMEPALQVATKLVVNSSKFLLSVLCANEIVTPGTRLNYLDVAYKPTVTDRALYWEMIQRLSDNHLLYLNDYGAFADGIYAASTMTSNSAGYAWWTTINSSFYVHYRRADYDTIPLQQRLEINFILATTLAHEFSHLGYFWRCWKQELASMFDERDIQQYLNYLCRSPSPEHEPCVGGLQRTPELGIAWEEYALEGHPGFKAFTDQSTGSDIVFEGIIWGRRGLGCEANLPTRLAIQDELAHKYNTNSDTAVDTGEVKRLVSIACWNLMEKLLDPDNMLYTGHINLLG